MDDVINIILEEISISLKLKQLDTVFMMFADLPKIKKQYLLYFKQNVNHIYLFITLKLTYSCCTYKVGRGEIVEMCKCLPKRDLYNIDTSVFKFCHFWCKDFLHLIVSTTNPDKDTF